MSRSYIQREELHPVFPFWMALADLDCPEFPTQSCQGHKDPSALPRATLQSTQPASLSLNQGQEQARKILFLGESWLCINQKHITHLEMP